MEIDTTCLKYVLHHSFIDKNEFINRDLGIELESLASSVDTFVPQECKEEFHQFIRNTTYKFLNNVYRTKDTIYHKTKVIRENRDIVILSGSIVKNKKDYNRKIDGMINEGIQQGRYEETDDNISKVLESFQSFLYQHFKNSPHYRQMLPSHQPAQFLLQQKLTTSEILMI